MANNLGPLEDLPIERFCNFVWWMLTNGANETERAKLRAKLWRPPVGQAVTDARSPWSAENENAALRALKTQLGGSSTPKSPIPG